MATGSWTLWAATEGTRGESWLTSTEQVILFAWLLKSSLVSVHMGHKYLYILCPSGEAYPHTSSPGFHLTDFPVVFLPNPRPSSRIISPSPWIAVESLVWPSIILGKMGNYMLCSKSCPQEEFPFTTVFQSSPKVGLQCSTYPLLGGFCTSWRITCKQTSSIFILSQLIIGKP